MVVLFDKDSKVVVQGITGNDGTFHTQKMQEYKTKVVAGVTPGKGGMEHLGVPVFNTVEDAARKVGANTSLIFVPAAFTCDAIIEAAAAGMRLIICITEGIPTIDMVKAFNFLKGSGSTLIGPNSPGIISPGIGKAGIMPAQIHVPGKIGVISRSGTLTYEAVAQLTTLGLGESTAMGLGGDPIIGTRHVDALRLFNEDKGTEGVIMIGEIGGTDEEIAARFIEEEMKKPVVAFIAGRTAPKGKRMGHAGAIIAGSHGTAAEKVEVLKAAGAHIAESPAEIGATMKRALKGK
jgi:succinyl-CoA synthetase alpha subunit